MAKFIKAVARGIQAMAEGPDAPVGDRFVVAGQPVRCGHCGHDHFDEGRAQLNTPLATLVRPDWVNTLTCIQCGRVELFRSEAGTLD